MFDSAKKAEGLDSSTFDIVKIDAFHNTRFGTILSYLWVWIMLVFKIAILAGDTYTCISILVFHRWSSLDYEVYEYKVAKWIFTGCIFFRFLLLAYQIAWGTHIYRTRNIALAYLNNYARLMYAIRSYNYQCLFHEIDQEGFFEWACFHVHTELDNALEVLVADLPRQVINFMTLRYYATGGQLNNDILRNIKTIATTNLRLSVILSFQLCTMILFLFFFFKFLLAIILYIPVKVKIAHKGFRLLKAFCYKSVNENVRFLVKHNHKSRTQILNEGILNFNEIQANPLLGTTSTVDLGSWLKPGGVDPFSDSYFDAQNSSTSNLYSHSLGAISLAKYPSQDEVSNLRKPPIRAYNDPESRENPFADHEAVRLPWEHKQEDFHGKNIFANPNNVTSTSHIPSQPPQISISHVPAVKNMVPNEHSVYTKSHNKGGPYLHGEFSNEQQPSRSTSLETTNSQGLILVGNEPGATSEHAEYLPSQSSIFTKSGYSKSRLTDLLAESAFDRNNDESYTALDEIPYPVRGVSQYFGNADDE